MDSATASLAEGSPDRPISVLAEWRAAWAGRYDNPLRIYLELTQRRARAKLPWWCRLIPLWVGLLFVGLDLLQRIQQQIQQGISNPPPTMASHYLPWPVTFTIAAPATLLSVWLAFLVYEALRDALGVLSSAPQLSLVGLDHALFARQSAAEVVVGSALAIARHLQFVLLLGIALNLVLTLSYDVLWGHHIERHYTPVTSTQPGQQFAWQPEPDWSVLTRLACDAPSAPTVEGYLHFMVIHRPKLLEWSLKPLDLVARAATALMGPLVLVLLFMALGRRLGGVLLVLPARLLMVSELPYWSLLSYLPLPHLAHNSYTSGPDEYLGQQLVMLSTLVGIAVAILGFWLLLSAAARHSYVRAVLLLLIGASPLAWVVFDQVGLLQQPRILLFRPHPLFWWPGLASGFLYCLQLYRSVGYFHPAWDFLVERYPQARLVPFLLFDYAPLLVDAAMLVLCAHFARLAVLRARANQT